MTPLTPNENNSSDDPPSLRGIQASETVLLRRDFDRDTRERLRLIEQKHDHLEHRMEQRMNEILNELHRIGDRQTEQGPALETLNKIVSSSIALRWLISAVVGALAIIATAITAWEATRKWW